MVVLSKEHKPLALVWYEAIILQSLAVTTELKQGKLVL